MQLQFTIHIWKKGDWFLAKCPELDFISQGTTRDEAEKNLMEVMQIQFEEMSLMGTLDDYLKECGYDFDKDTGTATPQAKMIGSESFEMQVV
ncbi:protein of unknown function UPF0150 [Desulfonatronospira thiodismutans ASO3-1]|uniref:Type II toxin-antitoxin system HicB family antitoxin n=1 Tax=Desulfonatronospira thiodismutans ASO3-1 TaxID=555779 RepID=D6SNL0_9BACT|nr:hypothetical protein [Desulfonatronospira thiodismutans]EFI34336.1 protein of unknown function UPF0150 [Desulfonatronospira thiodismutans ASO3-1]